MTTTNTTTTNRARSVLRADALKLGDQVFTPSLRWETVTGLGRGEAYSRSTRVITDATGPEYPWIWINRHPVLAQRAGTTLATQLGVAA